MEVGVINEGDAGQIEQDVADFAQSPGGGLIVAPSALSLANIELIIALAEKYKLPAIYYRRYFADKGGLISYGFDIRQQFRDAADYVDRVLKGAKPADLPVQAPTRYELVINLKTGRALGLTIPPSLFASADAVIE
jgi:putative ABC transport system substrate-binding protein